MIINSNNNNNNMICLSASGLVFDDVPHFIPQVLAKLRSFQLLPTSVTSLSSSVSTGSCARRSLAKRSFDSRTWSHLEKHLEK